MFGGGGRSFGGSCGPSGGGGAYSSFGGRQQIGSNQGEGITPLQFFFGLAVLYYMFSLANRA